MDQKQIFDLVEKFDRSRLAELKIETEGFKITLRSEAAVAGTSRDSCLHAVMPSFHSQPTAAFSAPVPLNAPSAPSPEPAAATEIITSPIVGSFYRSPAPDAPAYVDEGSIVKAGDPICIIEAMKIMNKLEADFSCEIVRVLAENGKMVEYGSPLFEVKRA